MMLQRLQQMFRSTKTPPARTVASIDDAEALAAFRRLLDQPGMTLGLAVAVGSDQALVAFAGEDEMFTDLAFSMAGPYRPWAFEQAKRIARALADPAKHELLEADRRRVRIAVGRYLVFLYAEPGEVDEPTDPITIDRALWEMTAPRRLTQAELEQWQEEHRD